MSRIVIDSYSLQAVQHLRSFHNGDPLGRLTSFICTIEGLGHSVCFEESLELEGGLKSADLLIILTRCPDKPIAQFLSGIHRFVLDGGSLLLMSNHSRVPSHPGMGHFTEEDGKLAMEFGIEISEACFCTDPAPSATIIRSTGTDDHPLLDSRSGKHSVTSVIINNGCGVNYSSKGMPVLLFPEGTVDKGPGGLSAKGHAFAWALETQGGRVLVTGDSGFVGEPNLPGSGPGLFDRGDNRLFIEQAITWLLAIPERRLI